MLATLALVAVVALILVQRREHDPPEADCRQTQGAAWCSTATESMTDTGVVRLVRGYCPRLRSLPVAQVRPQPLLQVGLPGRPGEVVLRTVNGADRVETGLLGQPGRLAWVVRRFPAGGGPGRLELICHEGADDVPALTLDPPQLRSAVQADAGRGGLDLRDAARQSAAAVRVSAGSRVSLGTFRCRTSPADLVLRPGSRFRCSLRLFSDQGQALEHLTFLVEGQPPHLRLLA